MGFGSGAIDSSLQPMLAQAYDNLLERKQIEKEKKNKINNSEDTINTLSVNRSDDKINIDIKKDDSLINDSSSVLHRDIGNINEQQENDKNNNQNDKYDDEDSEEAHNKYTRVFSLGNMALNIGFITGKYN